MDRARVLAFAVGLAGSAAALVAPEPGAAATVELEVAPPAPRSEPQAAIRYVGATGERNRLVILRESATSYLVQDATAPIAPGRNCRSVTLHEVRCSLSGSDVAVPLAAAIVTTEDGDDSIDLSGAPLDASVSAGAGDDVVRAPATGRSQVDGGDGRDELRGGARQDELLGGTGDDVLLGGAGNDSLDGDGSSRGGVGSRGGNDRLLGGAGADVLATHAGRDRLDGQRGADWYVAYLRGGIRGSVAADTGSSPGDRLRICTTTFCEGPQCRGVRVSRRTVRRGRQVLTHRGIEQLVCGGVGRR